MASNISLSVEKFSYTDSPPGQLRWHHDISSGIVFTYSPPYLKVTLGRKVLDSFDAHKQVQETEETIRAMTSSGITVSNDKLPVSAMIREGQPALAIKHARSSKGARRIQVKFPSTDDLTIARDIMRRAGIRVFNNSASSRPSTAQTDIRPLSEHNAGTQSIIIAPQSGFEFLHRAASATLRGSENPSSSPRLRRSAFKPPMHDAPNRLQISQDYPQERIFTETSTDDRPSTAPNFGSDEPLSAMMPPRRELPFNRPYLRDSSKRFIPDDGFAGSSTVTMTPSSSTQRPSTADLPPLKQPTYATRSTTVIEKKPKAANVPLTQDSELLRDQYIPAFLGASEALRDESLRPRPSLLKRPSSALKDLEDINKKQRSDPSAKAKPSTDSLRAGGKENYNLTDLISQAAHSSDPRILPSYAAQPQEVRDNMLSEFFVNCVEDDDFITLCQDVAANWRRIGLGL
ncbi:hypothetical protein MPH_11314 [Macrophomina phaseolina MS6]|uniref:Uncharacterized protein n=1 Tax=Macrophomina phaseolina (strain MS6) TaxID=1126212 RepID=K2RB91_MACPH|nr:hypothetical protein MPH_11314 [Macrophomina phaseolina MS6]